MPVGVISMPSAQRHDTLPERPGDSPERLIASAVSMTARRASCSAAFAFAPTYAQLLTGRLAATSATSSFAEHECTDAIPALVAGIQP